MRLRTALGIGRRRPVFAEHVGHAGHQLGIVGEVGRRQDLSRRVGPYGQPVAKVVVATGGPEQVGVVAHHVRHVALHRVPVALEDPHIAVAAIHRPRHDDGPVRPARRPVALDHEPRGDIGIGAFRGLPVEDVVAPLGHEGRDVHVVCGGGEEHLGVAHPAQPLVALRAVGRDRDEVAALAPGDVPPQLVDHLVGALEPTSPGRVRVHDAAGDRVERRRVGIAGHLDVAEAVEGEARLPDLLAVAAQDVSLDRPCPAQVVDVSEPSGSSISAKRRRTRVPRSPCTARRTQPTMFWPRSKTCTPRAGIGDG